MLALGQRNFVDSEKIITGKTLVQCPRIVATLDLPTRVNPFCLSLVQQAGYMSPRAP